MGDLEQHLAKLEKVFSREKEYQEKRLNELDTLLDTIFFRVVTGWKENEGIRNILKKALGEEALKDEIVFYDALRKNDYLVKNGEALSMLSEEIFNIVMDSLFEYVSRNQVLQDMLGVAILIEKYKSGEWNGRKLSEKEREELKLEIEWNIARKLGITTDLLMKVLQEKGFRPRELPNILSQHMSKTYSAHIGERSFTYLKKKYEQDKTLKQAVEAYVEHLRSHLDENDAFYSHIGSLSPHEKLLFAYISYHEKLHKKLQEYKLYSEKRSEIGKILSQIQK